MIRGFCHKADNDGYTSAAILKFKYPEIVLTYMDYGDDFPWNEIADEDVVYMCDFSLDIEDMIRLDQICNFHWIDHHNSAIVDKDKSKHTFKGIQRNGLGASGLTWEYLFPDTPMPKAVRYLADYDVWNLADPNATLFEFGMRTFQRRYLDNDSNIQVDELWNHLLSENEEDPKYSISTILERGQVAIDYFREFSARYCQVAAFETTFDGYRTLACNILGVGSTVFESIKDHNEYDIHCIFGFVGDGWNIGWYCDTGIADVGQIAKRFGGGGHKSSSGAHTESLPPELLDPKNIKSILID